LRCFGLELGIAARALVDIDVYQSPAHRALENLLDLELHAAVRAFCGIGGDGLIARRAFHGLFVNNLGGRRRRGGRNSFVLGGLEKVAEVAVPG
jgi:hypothetical protein